MIRRTILLFCLVACTLEAAFPRQTPNGSMLGEGELAPDDSLLVNILTNVAQYSEKVKAYEAQMYLRGQYRAHRRNELIRFVPRMFRFYKDVDDYLTEAVGEIHYTYPDVYDMKVRALTGTFKRNRPEIGNSLEYFNMNLYSPTLLPDRLISPLWAKGSTYYTYSLDSLSGRGDSLRYYIRIEPKKKSSQLVSGLMVVSHGDWLIRRIKLQGEIELTTFSLAMEMGDEGAELLLPKRFDVNLMFRFLWNKIEADMAAEMTYQSVDIREEWAGESAPKSKYDLTDAYRLKCDDSQMVNDTAYVAAHRPYALTDEQESIYANYYQRRKVTELTVPEPKRKSQHFWNDVGDALVSSYTLDLPRMGSVRFSPLLDWGMFSYSPKNGFSYKQQFRYNRVFADDKWVRFVPKVGYNFTRKEFYWSGNLDFFYAPSRLGALTLRIGNGNRIYTSRLVDELKQLKDTLIDFEKLHLEYFKDNYVQLGNRIELANGLELMTVASMHWRKAVQASEMPAADPLMRHKTISSRPTYVTFAPRVRLAWTPALYYYMDGKRKVNLRSKYPTFTIDYEKGIKGVLGSNGSYERIESDIQQRIKLMPMTYLFYRVGGGAFTEQRSVYFVDFVNFARSNLPVGWNDEIGGAFHLLDGEWYNSSRWYSRLHLTYEAPFVLIPHTSAFTGLVHSERFYLSLLYNTHLRPYVEMGYGVGTYLFDAGLFVSNVNGRFSEVGCKFTFELFSR